MATAKNDITGDLIATRLKSVEYDKNYDTIFPEKFGQVTGLDGKIIDKCSKRCWVEFVDGNPICNKPNCGGVYGRT
jgi:hypothetical protein